MFSSSFDEVEWVDEGHVLRNETIRFECPVCGVYALIVKPALAFTELLKKGGKR